MVITLKEIDYARTIRIVVTLVCTTNFYNLTDSDLILSLFSYAESGDQRFQANTGIFRQLPETKQSDSCKDGQINCPGNDQISIESTVEHQ